VNSHADKLFKKRKRIG
jgi:hypothetical protein